MLAHLPAGHAAYLTGRSFFPSVISPSFKIGLRYAFDFAIGCSIIAAIASLLRGGRYVHGQEEPSRRTSEDDLDSPAEISIRVAKDVRVPA